MYVTGPVNKMICRKGAHPMKCLTQLLTTLVVVPWALGAPANAQEGVIAPGETLVVDGIPAVPTSLAETAGRYAENRSAFPSGWHFSVSHQRAFSRKVSAEVNPNRALTFARNAKCDVRHSQAVKRPVPLHIRACGFGQPGLSKLEIGNWKFETGNSALRTHNLERALATRQCPNGDIL